MLRKFWRLLVGSPLPSHHLHHTRLPKFLALPVFASDALSSTAYATQEIVIPLMIAGGVAALTLSLPVSIAIAVLLAVVAISYTQTIKTYPQGASCYLVAKDNLGTIVSLIAGAGLLTDYILTVAVSVASGVEQLTSALPVLKSHTVGLCILVVMLITVVNLRGQKESGWFFALPTYLFILCMYALVVKGIYMTLSANFQPLATPADMENRIREIQHADPAIVGLGIMLLLRAFSHGCTALTGIEAVSDGVGAFEAPEARNASVTLGWMALILSTLFLGLSYLAGKFNAMPIFEVGGSAHEINVTDSLISVLSKAIFGGGSLGYFIITAATMLILFLAANTAFADFPRLASFLGADRFLPHQFTNLGDRLVFSNGIIFLGLVASILLAIFGGNTHMLLPLYAIGVFLSFTLSQASMVINWLRTRRRGWIRGIILNGFGAVCTTVVFLVLIWFRFTEGARIVLALIPLLVLMFAAINRHYQFVKTRLALDTRLQKPVQHNTVLVLIPNLNRGVIHALEYAKSITKSIRDVRGVHIDTDGKATDNLKQMWEGMAEGIPLVILESPFRSLVEPTLEYIEEVKQERADDTVTVVIPEFVPTHWWHTFLHNQAGLVLKLMLMFRRDIIVTNVRYWLQDDERKAA